MAEHGKDSDEAHLQGFSVVDSLSTGSVKTEENVAETAADNDGTSEEKFDCKREETDDEVGVLVLDDRDTKNVKDIEYKEPNQSTLIITTEDLLDSTTFEDSKDVEVKKEKSPEIPEQKKKPKSKRDDHNYFWVSNISRQVKAVDLKKFFSQLGKVLTAKILTNGKNYFGYVSMNSNELAAKCIKQFNNTTFDGKKILVSKDRPDLKEVKAPVKVEPKKKKELKKPEPAVEERATKSDSVESKEKRSNDHSNGVIADLKKKLERAKSDVNRYKWKVMEFQRRHEGMRKKCETLERELKDAQYKLRDERRKLNQDREQFEKNKKLEQIRFDADRAIVNKELDEVKKLREHLKEKIEEFKVQTKKAPKRRSRSPIVHRRRSPPLRANNSNSVFRPEDKKRKREEISRGRTPPPPPKLSEVVSKKRERENNAPNRGYFGDVSKVHEYDYRHAKSSYAPPQDEMRGSWLTPFPKDPRRAGPSSSSSNSFPEMRYGSGYQFPSSGLSGPPRSYYPEFGKTYGPY